MRPLPDHVVTLGAGGRIPRVAAPHQSLNAKSHGTPSTQGCRRAPHGGWRFHGWPAGGSGSRLTHWGRVVLRDSDISWAGKVEDALKASENSTENSGETEPSPGLPLGRRNEWTASVVHARYPPRDHGSERIPRNSRYSADESALQIQHSRYLARPRLTAMS